MPTALSPSPAPQRLDSLDMLRGVAIFMVVAFHVSIPFGLPAALTTVASLGNAGVQLFFLISAWTMCHMWVQRQGEPQAAARFYLRRFFRIAPLFWLAMVFYNGLRAWQTGHLGEVGPLDLVLTALFLHPFSVHAINLAVPGGWSIGVEMCFYLLFPWLVMRWQTPQARLALALAAYLVGTAAMVALRPVLDTPQGERFLYYSLLTQLPVFAVGMALFALLQQPPGQRRAAWRRLLPMLAVWLGLAFAGKAMGLLTRPFFWLQVFMLAAGLAWTLQRGWAWAPLRALGRWSYSIYLFHFFLLDTVALLWPVAAPRASWHYLPALGMVLALSALAGWASARTLEAWSQGAGRAAVAWLARRRGPHASVSGPSA
ncbi:acyltransferase family protein [Ideonella livida]|uniref:Acyltransferase n=1 Tax=Ideonella livida TaxID=2707176 RepID=A0A7C9TM09_9BURK|nr:acyltransferase [Ideonella livida]NDY93899.1 acyltransferase [Ideonella livida]